LDSVGSMKDELITHAWSVFVRDAVGELTNQQVADRIGVSDTTVGNWVNGKNFTQPDANKVVAFARAFGRPIPKALAAAGIVEEHEFDETVVVRREPDEMSTDEMLDSVMQMVATIRDREHPKASPRRTGAPKAMKPRRRPRLLPDYKAPDEAPDL
jgi:transcriptional regulator with XRE-family HTH domain